MPGAADCPWACLMPEWKDCLPLKKTLMRSLKHNLIDKKNHFNWPSWLSVSNHDINEVLINNHDELRKLQGKVDIVAGGPPCQGFSMAGKRDENDERNQLVDSYLQFVRIVKPRALIFENVHGFTVEFKESTGIKTYSNYVYDELHEMGYSIDWDVIDVSDYGIPQKRKRFILVAIKDRDPKAVFIKLKSNASLFCRNKGIKEKTTIEEAISDLREKAGTCISPDSKRFSAGKYGEIESGYQRLMRFNCPHYASVDSHRFVNHSKRIVELHNQLLEKATKGKRITPKDHEFANLKRRGVTVLDPKSQSPTITSIPDEIVHYEEPRILTVREHARLQSFPDWYEIKGKYTSGGKRRKAEVPRYTQIGNAVPPLFAEQIGLALMEVLNGTETV